MHILLWFMVNMPIGILPSSSLVEVEVGVVEVRIGLTFSVAWVWFYLESFPL